MYLQMQILCQQERQRERKNEKEEEGEIEKKGTREEGVADRCRFLLLVLLPPPSFATNLCSLLKVSS